MRNLIVVACAAILAWSGSALAQTPPPLDNPEKFSADVIQIIARGETSEAAKIIAQQVGQPGATNNLRNALQVFEGKKFDYSKKVIDNQFEGALRQIVHYAYVETVGFIYFRFNFKMTSKGWILAHFTFKSETNELFPKEYL